MDRFSVSIMDASVMLGLEPCPCSFPFPWPTAQDPFPLFCNAGAICTTTGLPALQAVRSKGNWTHRGLAARRGLDASPRRAVGKAAADVCPDERGGKEARLDQH